MGCIFKLTLLRTKNDEKYNQIAICSIQHAQSSELAIRKNIQHYAPVITNFIQKKFGKSFEKLRNDIEKKAIRFMKQNTGELY